MVATEYDSRRTHPSGLLNVNAMIDVARRQSIAVGGILDDGRLPVVLGGDDSILFGALLALDARGTYGLAFLDAHTDFYEPLASPTGQASDSEILLSFGHGPPGIAELGGAGALVAAEHSVLIGQRDPVEPGDTGDAVAASNARLIDLEHLRQVGVASVVAEALDRFEAADLDGFLIHIDADVLSDELMPAVDYRVPGGLSADEFTSLVAGLLDSDRVVALEVSIYNPTLDPRGEAGAHLVRLLDVAFRRAGRA